MLDTVRAVTTPELIELELHPAGLLPRAAAWLLDLGLRGALLILASQLLEAFGRFGSGMLLIVYFMLDWFYPVLFEVLWGGATPGKRAFGLMVVHDDGTPVGWTASLARNLLRAADFLPLGYAAGVISVLLHREFRRLGDIVAGTLVVYREQRDVLQQIPEAEPVAPPGVPDRATQRALFAFAERARSLTPARQEELAELLPALAFADNGPKGAARLIGIANHLAGRRA